MVEIVFLSLSGNWASGCWTAVVIIRPTEVRYGECYSGTNCFLHVSGRASDSGEGGRGFDSGRVIPKALKLVVMAALLVTRGCGASILTDCCQVNRLVIHTGQLPGKHIDITGNC